MRIGLVCQDLTVRGGGQRLVLTQARLLQARGHQVTVFTPAHSREVYPTLAKELELEVISPTPVWRRLPLLSRTISGLDRVLKWMPRRLANQDLIVGYTFPSNIVAYRAHVKWGIPAIWHCTHPSYELYPRSKYDRNTSPTGSVAQGLTRVPLRILDIKAGRSFSQVAVISSKISYRVRSIYGLPSTVLFPIVDPAEFSWNGLNRNNSNCVLYVGRLVWNKGPDLFLRVMKGVLSKMPATTGIMALAGQATNSSAFREFRRRIVEMGIQDRIELITEMTDESFDIGRLYGRSDVVAYTCRDEDFGLVPLEASLCGRPSVLWDDCGCVQDKILEDQRSGLIASHYDVDSFVSKVSQLLADSNLREELSVNARISTLRNCHPNVHVDSFESLMSRTL